MFAGWKSWGSQVRSTAISLMDIVQVPNVNVRDLDSRDRSQKRDFTSDYQNYLMSTMVR